MMNAGLMMMRNARHTNSSSSSNRTNPRCGNSGGRNVSIDSLKNIWKMVRCEPEWDNYVNSIESNNDKIYILSNELHNLQKKNNSCRGDEITLIEKKARELSVTIRNGTIMNDEFTEWRTKTFYRKKSLYYYDM